MSVVLMVERGVIPGAQQEIKELLRELRSKATRQPGFISGQTVVDAFNPTNFMTISTWSSIAAWHSWEADPDRADTIARINGVIQGTPKQRLWVTDEDAPAAAI